MKTKRNTEILQAIPTGTTMWKWMLGALVVPYGAVRVCIVGYRWTDVGVMTEHNPPRQQLPTLVTLWHWGLQGKGGGFWASRQIAQQYDHRKNKHLTLRSLHQVYRSSQGWWFWLWTLNGSTKLLHSRHTQSDTHLHLLLTFSAAAFVPIGTVDALGSILAGSAGALINVDLTHGASKPWDRQT